MRRKFPERTTPAVLCALLVLAAACADRSARTDDSAVSVAISDTASLAAPDTSRYIYVTEYGIGDIRAGMTLADAERAAPGIRLVPGADSTECSYLEWTAAPPGVLVMFDAGRIARVDIDSAGIRTDAGVQVGDSEARVDSVYAGRVKTTPHKYTEGHYLVVTPIRTADSLYRMVFEAEGGRVTRYRVGMLPQVEYVEGCS